MVHAARWLGMRCTICCGSWSVMTTLWVLIVSEWKQCSVLYSLGRWRCYIQFWSVCRIDFCHWRNVGCSICCRWCGMQLSRAVFCGDIIRKWFWSLIQWRCQSVCSVLYIEKRSASSSVHFGPETPPLYLSNWKLQSRSGPREKNHDS
jgi:hypothetical protein